MLKQELSSFCWVQLFFRGVGGLLGPLIAGFIKDRTGAYECAFVFCALAAALSSLVSLAASFLPASSCSSGSTTTSSRDPAAVEEAAAAAVPRAARG